MPIFPPRKAWLFTILLVSLQLISFQLTHTAEADIDDTSELWQQAEDLKKAGYYSKAIPFVEKILADQRAADGVNQANLAKILDYLGELNYLAGRYAPAEPLLTESLSIRKELYGPDNVETVESYYHLGTLLTLERKYWQAEEYFNKDITIRKNNYGLDHPTIAVSLVKLARLYLDKGNPTKAKPLLNEALSIQEKAFGKNHPNLLPTLNTLAWLYIDTRDYDKAEMFLQRALLIGKNEYGPEHPYIAESIDYLARLHYERQDYEASISFSKRALEIREKFLGPNHPDVGLSLTYLARTYFKLNQFDKGQKLIIRAEQIGRKVFESNYQDLPSTSRDTGLANKYSGDSANDIIFVENESKLEKIKKFQSPSASSQYNKAKYHRDIGNRYFFNKEYDKAEHYFQLVLDYCDTNSDQTPELCCKAMDDMGALKLGVVQSDEGFSYFESALSLAEKHFPPDHIIIADILVNIGHYYSSIADYRNSLSPYERALKIFENKFHPNHSSVLQIYFALGRLYLFEDDIGKALYFTEKAMVGIEKTLGTDSELYARCLFNLGFIHHGKKEFDQAEQFYSRAIDIWEKNLGPTFQPQAITHTLLARLYAEKGDFEKASACLIKCHKIVDKSIDQITDFTSEGQQLYRAEEDIYTMQKYLDLIGNYYREDRQKIKEAFNVWLKGKGRILDLQARLYEFNLSGDNPESVKLFQELEKVRAKLSRMAFSKPGIMDGSQHEQKIEELQRKKNQLEAQLSRISKPFATKRKMAKAYSEQISKMLPNGSVLLEFARTQSILENSKGGVGNSYIAFILHANEGNNVGMVDLGDADQIDSLITKYKIALAESNKGHDTAAVATSRELYDLIFHPLLKYISSSKNIFISPDGNLSLMPFEVLQNHDGSFLIEEYTINYLSAGRDFVGFTNDRSANGKCLLMGAPDFNLASLNIPPDGKASPPRSADLTELSFVPLNYAKTELEAISMVMGADQSELHIGKDALEETLLNADHPAIIHLATHGFFLSDQKLPGTGRGFQMAALPAAGEQSNLQVNGKIEIENPLLRSGILLAGAKRSLAEGCTGFHDGIVTAEKILGMNLHGTEMVVLSACDTGLGEVRSGEGVFGLRRAFTQAGANSLVMSLWKVPDKETKELMIQFYRNIKSGTMNRCQALRQAILKEKEIVRKRYGHDNPRYWGAFVFMGQP